MAMTQVFLHHKGNCIRFTKLLFQRKIIKCAMYSLLVNFQLQITYKKVKNLQIGVDKFVEKVSINLLCPAKSALLNLCPTKSALLWMHFLLYTV